MVADLALPLAGRLGGIRWSGRPRRVVLDRRNADSARTIH